MKTKLKDKRLKSVVGDSVWDSVWDFVERSFWWTVYDCAGGVCWGPVGESVRSFVYDSVRDSVVNSVKRKCLDKSRNIK